MEKQIKYAKQGKNLTIRLSWMIHMQLLMVNKKLLVNTSGNPSPAHVFQESATTIGRRKPKASEDDKLQHAFSSHSKKKQKKRKEKQRKERKRKERKRASSSILYMCQMKRYETFCTRLADSLHALRRAVMCARTVWRISRLLRICFSGRNPHAGSRETLHKTKVVIG